MDKNQWALDTMNMLRNQQKELLEQIKQITEELGFVDVSFSKLYTISRMMDVCKRFKCLEVDIYHAQRIFDQD